MADSSQQKKTAMAQNMAQNFKRAAADPGSRLRFGVVVVALLVAIVIVGLMRNRGGGESVAEARGPTYSGVGVPDLEPPVPGEAAKNPVPHELERQAEMLRAKHAASQGDSYVPPIPILDGDDQPPQPGSVAVPRDPRLEQRRSQEQEEQRQRRAERIAAMFDQIEAAHAPVQLAVTYFAYPEEDAGDPVGLGRDGLQTAGGASGLGIEAGTRWYATITGKIDSYVPGPVRAVLEDGPFAGGVLMGDYQSHNDYFIIEFSSLSYNGVKYSIKAIAIDPYTEVPGIAAKVDNHYLKRFGLAAGAALVSKLAESLTFGGSLVSTSTVTVETEPKLSDRERLAYATGAAVGEVVLPALAEEAATTSKQLSKEKNTPIGVLLIEPL